MVKVTGTLAVDAAETTLVKLARPRRHVERTVAAARRVHGRVVTIRVCGISTGNKCQYNEK